MIGAPVLVERPLEALRGDELASVIAGELSGVVVPGFLSPETCEAVRRRVLEALSPLEAAPFPGVTYGAVLVVSPPDRRQYRAAWAALEGVLRPWGLPEVFAEAFAAMGAEAETPPGYAALTVRVLESGQEVAVHSERTDWPAMVELAPRLEGTTVSFYVPLALEGGGELVIYHRPPPGQEPPIGGLPPSEAAAALAAFGETRLRPGVGDLLVFDGGRFNHRVSPARGQRWTLGGFAARRRGGAELLFWS